ncbi:unnamed protein product [Coffea canephora]|uniref:Uncharacterized protein n=1 Tax=Coffea canephora TaxID=49390 RepID=A0A068V8N1_COFCA|nr:unnamed protein product [Coffea canephora]
MWILNWVVSGTFADLHQDPDPPHHLARNVLTKAQKGAARVRVKAGVGAVLVVGAKLHQGELWYSLVFAAP